MLMGDSLAWMGWHRWERRWGPGYHSLKPPLQPTFVSWWGWNGNCSADSRLPSTSEYRCALLKKEGLGHFGSMLAFWC